MVQLNALKEKMESSLASFKKDLSGLRTGRASPNLLDAIMVDAYGSPTPISQVGNVNVPEPRLLTVQVWDQSLVASVEKAIRNSELGLNPASDGQLIRVPVPQLTEERRVEIAKIAGKYAEEARIAIRNIRRTGMDGLKKDEKDGEISEDEMKKSSNDVQQVTDDYISKVDDLLSQKEKEITSI